MNAEERSRKWIEELDEIETMTEQKLLAECRQIEAGGGLAGAAAGASIRIWETADEDRDVS